MKDHQGIRYGDGIKPKETGSIVKQISAKLHPDYDQDLIRRISNIPRRDRSRIYREAVRSYLDREGIR